MREIRFPTKRKRSRKLYKKKKNNTNIMIDESYISEFKQINFENDIIALNIAEKINSTKDYLHSKNQLMTFCEYFFASTPFPCKSSENKKVLYQNALIKSANKYLDTLISVESLIDTNITLRKMMNILFNSSQLEAINYIQSSSFETFFENINKYDDAYLFNLDYDDQFFDSKKFLFCLRKNSILDEKTSVKKIEEVMMNAKEKRTVIDQKIISAFVK